MLAFGNHSAGEGLIGHPAVRLHPCRRAGWPGHLGKKARVDWSKQLFKKRKFCRHRLSVFFLLTKHFWKGICVDIDCHLTSPNMSWFMRSYPTPGSCAFCDGCKREGIYRFHHCAQCVSAKLIQAGGDETFGFDLCEDCHKEGKLVRPSEAHTRKLRNSACIGINFEGRERNCKKGVAQNTEVKSEGSFPCRGCSSEAKQVVILTREPIDDYLYSISATNFWSERTCSNGSESLIIRFLKYPGNTLPGTNRVPRPSVVSMILMLLERCSHVAG